MKILLFGLFAAETFMKQDTRPGGKAQPSFFAHPDDFAAIPLLVFRRRSHAY